MDLLLTYISLKMVIYSYLARDFCSKSATPDMEARIRGRITCSFLDHFRMIRILACIGRAVVCD